MSYHFFSKYEICNHDTVFIIESAQKAWFDIELTQV